MPGSTIPIISADAVRQRKRERPRGRHADATVREELQQWLGQDLTRRDLLIEHLHVINDRLGCLPAPQLVALAALMKLPQAEVFEVASFYHHFEVIKEGPDGVLLPLPGLRVRVCDGLPCAMAGGEALRVRLSALLGPQVQVVAVPCVGRCETAPVAVVHQNAVTHATADAVVRAVQASHTAPAATKHIDLDAYRAQGGYALLRECTAGARDPLQLIELMEAAGLRGLGGAGFPAGRKWRIVRSQPAPRLMAVNLDEGEPGTFKDRVLLETDPHRFIEGLWIAAWAVGVTQVTVYLRDEYHGCRQMLLAELARLRADPPAPGLPEIVLRRGAGAYICGEESAMIESIEGRRGLPRLRPPYVAERGLFGRPTLVHNLETLYWVRELVERGAAWFANQGRQGRQGLRRFSVSGRVCSPGVKLAPAGITLRELVDEHCGGMLPGHQLYAYLPGGASGGILPERLADLPLDFDTLQAHGAFIGSAAVIVLSQHDRAVDAARNVMRFFAHESCGQCTPCRAGTAKAVALMVQPRWDAPLLGELGQVMRDASICGLGQAAPNAFDSVLKFFPHEVQA
jgi:NADH:ubiquinone oxidoreductase subunit F (NADH-binding)/NADH:ubiquinone oxidoreductase subunit E